MDGARPDALSDAQLDRELEAALGVEPSPEFLARVRTRIASEPRAPGESGFSRMLQPQAFVESGFSRILQHSVEPLWAVAIVGIVLAIVVPQLIRDGKPAVATTDGRPLEPPRISAGSGLGSGAIGRGLGPVDVIATGPTRSASRTQKRRPRTPKVLISEDERQAFDALLTAVAENRLPVRSTPVEEAVSSLAIAPLQIQQLRIEPLHVAGLQGVNGS